MLLILEAARPCQRAPWVYRNRAERSLEVGWLWFAIRFTHEAYEKLVMEPHDWVCRGRRYASVAETRRWASHPDRVR